MLRVNSKGYFRIYGFYIVSFGIYRNVSLDNARVLLNLTKGNKWSICWGKEILSLVHYVFPNRDIF